MSLTAGRLDQVDVASVVGALAHLLHRAGVPATPERGGRLAAAIALSRPATTDELYWLGRVTLVTGRDQIGTYDRVFAQVFRGIVDVADTRGDTNAPTTAASNVRRDPSKPKARSSAIDGGGERRTGAAGTPGRPDDGEPETVLAAASSEERLRTTAFAALTPDELDALRSLVEALPFVPPVRASRRHQRHRLGSRVDLRATLRRAHRTGGDAVRHVRRRPKVRPRRLVLLADVSGSMQPTTRAYLHLLHGAVRATKAEAFVFATRLTRLTRALNDSDPDAALTRAGLLAPDWSGGTRIGAALQAFNDGYGRRGLARGAVVVIVSDGWERDDPARLGEQMARLGRLAHRVVWVNPRAAAAGFEPLAAGMQAALPHVDRLVSGHSLEALDEVLEAINSA